MELKHVRFLGRDGIDLAVKADIDGINLFAGGCTDESLTSVGKMMGMSLAESKDWHIKTYGELTEYAKDHGLLVTVHMGNPVGGKFNFVYRLFRAGEENHADGVNISDSRGTCLPQAYARFTKKMKKEIK